MFKTFKSLALRLLIHTNVNARRLSRQFQKAQRIADYRVFTHQNEADLSYEMRRCLRQMELEKLMRGIGFERVEKAVAEAKADGRESETGYGQKLLLSVVDPLSARIRQYLSEALVEGKAGKHQRAAVKMKLLNPDAVAYLAAKTILDNVANRTDLQVAHEIGRAVEEEARFQAYHEQLPALFDTIQRDHKKRRKSKAFTKRVLKLRLAKAGAVWEDWAERDCMQLGFKLIELFLQDERQFVIKELMTVRKSKKFHASYRLVFGPGITELIEDSKELSALLTPGFLPTVVAPKPWHAPFDGAYWTNAVDKKARRLVKTRNMNYMEELRHVEMGNVYAALNAVQETPWKINERVLDVMHEAWKLGREIGSLPSEKDWKEPVQPVAKPPCRCYCDTKKEWSKTPDGQAWKAWRRMAHDVHERNVRGKSRRVQAAKVLWVADMFRDDAAIYFPHQLDFRSRVYAMPMFLHPQGPDYARGLLMFAEGKAITNPMARNWLAIHGANSYGIDKVSFHERVDWVRKHGTQILATADDPMANVDWWGEAENPWQFLAFCFEWSAMAANPEGFVSYLPVSLDGTCNGLQHFSAMLRDPIGGAAVNLMPSDKPQDIYARVAERVVERLNLEVCDVNLDAGVSDLAAKWLAFGVNRKLTKRPVMILPYGGTQYACRKYVEQYVLDLVMDKGQTNPFGNGLMDAVVYLSQIIWQAIGETVVAAKDAMQWLRKIARLMTQHQLPVVWQTPVGFPVRQAYPQMRNAVIEFVVDGKRIRRRVNSETDGLDRERQINGLSPNFVHSLDAAALMESVIQARHRGITSFAMVHDSYGTTAAETEALADTLRRAFVSLYQKHDVLAELRAAVVEALPAGTDVPEVPASGSLNIDAVLDSRFFFA